MQRVRDENNERWEDDHAARLRREPLRKGDLVLLYNTKIVKDYGSKLSFIWLGPYRVNEVTTDRNRSPTANFVLEELDGTVLRWGEQKNTVHGDRLRKFVVAEGGSEVEVNMETGLANIGAWVDEGAGSEVGDRAQLHNRRQRVEESDEAGPMLIDESEESSEGGDGDGQVSTSPGERGLVMRPVVLVAPPPGFD